MWAVNFWKMYIFKVLPVFSGLNLKDLITDLCVRQNLHSEIDINEKKDKANNALLAQGNSSEDDGNNTVVSFLTRGSIVAIAANRKPIET